MGFLDILLSKQMKKRKAATEIAIESGLFVQCPICQGVTEAGEPSALRPATEDLVRKLMREGDPRIHLFGDDVQALLTTIAEVSSHLPYRCTCHNI
jgi:hypothetical protein